MLMQGFGNAELDPKTELSPNMMIVVRIRLITLAHRPCTCEKLLIARQSPVMASSFGSDNIVSQLGTALLRISPLVISSASLMFSWSQDISLGAFLHPSLLNDAGHPSGKLLPRYLSAFMSAGLWGIGLTYPPATVICVVNSLSRQSRAARNLYLAGAVFSIAHFCWGPTMFALLGRIGDVKTAGVRNEDALKEWMRKHRARTLLVNIPAFLCILAATLITITEGFT
ncbi:hypothetical protein PRK78_000805 [Emydomyces testavorans]|uniref:Uncharacterized protein n=1 Tax=Emydomyces testavorans TaxID=2070801 RepID=A0AAF0IET6_9EURO|nr:hypothetical protein PRK78_000805 [Emydomyces testavorans]